MTATQRSWLIALAWIAAGILLATRFMPGEPPPQLPALTLTTLDGRQIDPHALQGHPVLVTFWSITCGPCLHEIPDLIDLHNELAPKGLVILAIAMPYDPPNRVLALVRERKLPYDIVLDPMGKTSATFGEIQYTPTTFLFDGEGHGVTRIVGGMNIREMRERIIRLLPKQLDKQPLALINRVTQTHALD